MAEGNEQSKKLGELIIKTWSDEAFKEKLISDTMAVLKENDIAVPEGITVKALENTDKVFYLVIPPKPSSGELSDIDLDNISGGNVWRFLREAWQVVAEALRCGVNGPHH